MMNVDLPFETLAISPQDLWAFRVQRLAKDVMQTAFTAATDWLKDGMVAPIGQGAKEVLTDILAAKMSLEALQAAIEHHGVYPQNMVGDTVLNIARARMSHFIMGLSYSPKQGVSEAYQLAEQEEKPEWLLQALAGASTAAFLAIQADVRQFVAHIIEED